MTTSELPGAPHRVIPAAGEGEMTSLEDSLWLKRPARTGPSQLSSVGELLIRAARVR
jgi:hypothetical protein